MNNSHPDTGFHAPANTVNGLLTTGRILFEGHSSAVSDPQIISGKYQGRDIAITLSQFRGIVSLLHDELFEMGIHKGTRIMLVSFSSTSELLKTIYFVSLVTMGAKVFMPRKCGTDELIDWINKTSPEYALIPGKELISHVDNEAENTMLLAMNEMFISSHVALLDTVSSFPLDKFISSGAYLSMHGDGGRYQVYKQVRPEDEALILNFPGINGNSALKTYTQEEIVLQPIPVKLPISTLFRLAEEDEPSVHKSSRPYL